MFQRDQHTFAKVPQVAHERSSFDRSHGVKTTLDAGYLVPVYVDEALPGDTFNLQAHLLGRLSTPIKALMDNLYLDTFFFAVPYRLVWDNFVKMMGEQDNPTDSIAYTIPQMVSPAGSGYAVGSLSDYFGIPTGVPGLTHSALWHRAYNLIWNQWFRDENLQNSVTVDKGDAASNPSDYVLLQRGKRHDYFTSCLPWPQKGTAVSLPIGSSALVKYSNPSPQHEQHMLHAVTGVPAGASLSWSTGANGQILLNSTAFNVDPNGTMYADLSTATASTINDIRQAFQLQRMLERDARGGTRYTELIRSHFGVTSPDARLQRPEYLGGGTIPINVHPVPQTSVSAATPQGNVAGYGVVSGRGNGFVKSFTEHTLIIGMVCIRADLNYQQGLNRMFSRSTRADHFWPALAHLGEQAVLNKEIYATGGSTDTGVFGYQERYAEYRFKPSCVTGKFRSTYATPLDTWHLAQNFGSLPTLSPSFIVENPPIARVVAVPSEPHLILDGYFKLTCARPMPVFGVPGMLDHF